MTSLSEIKKIKSKIDGMLSPVLCTHCNEIYDLTEVSVIRRYADSTVFETPCCHRRADDRTWKGSPDIKPLKSEKDIWEAAFPFGIGKDAIDVR